MSLYRRKDSPYWWVKLSPIRGESGPLQVSTGITERRKATEFHDKLKSQRWEQDKLGAKPSRTWEEAVVKFLGETGHKRTHDRDRDKSILRWLDCVLGGKHLDEIDRTLIDQIKVTRAKIATQSTANRYLAVIRSVLRKACNEWEWVDRVPKVSLFREKDGRIRSLSAAEFLKLHSELPPHLADMALFSVATGLRQANVSQLEWSQVNLELLHAVIPPEKHKNGRPHPVPLNEAAVEVIKRKVGQHPTHVFTFRGKPVTQVSTKAWRDALVRAGIDNFRWHDLRHTFATWHRQAGTPTHELQRLGGWKTLSMVERYAHVAPEGLQIAAGRLDNALRGYAMATLEEKGDRP
jgi:integrase